MFTRLLKSFFNFLKRYNPPLVFWGFLAAFVCFFGLLNPYFVFFLFLTALTLVLKVVGVIFTLAIVNFCYRSVTGKDMDLGSEDLFGCDHQEKSEAGK